MSYLIKTTIVERDGRVNVLRGSDRYAEYRDALEAEKIVRNGLYDDWSNGSIRDYRIEIEPADPDLRVKHMKQDLQKMVKMYRDTLPMEVYYDWRLNAQRLKRPENPKAMMTEKQMKNKTATINCGRNGEEKARDRIEWPQFRHWCESYGVKNPRIEVNSDGGYQIRVEY
ncbi:MAG: hypothetical protein IKQ24_07250 [Verrucomicrobia bacterium]|nr:hypothetical protein [Verrucomicrobiota bacterium]